MLVAVWNMIGVQQRHNAYRDIAKGRKTKKKSSENKQSLLKFQSNTFYARVKTGVSSADFLIFPALHKMAPSIRGSAPASGLHQTGKRRRPVSKRRHVSSGNETGLNVYRNIHLGIRHDWLLRQFVQMNSRDVTHVHVYKTRCNVFLYDAVDMRACVLHEEMLRSPTRCGFGGAFEVGLFGCFVFEIEKHRRNGQEMWCVDTMRFCERS